MAPDSKNIGLIGLSAKGSWASRSHIHYLTNTPLYKITALQNSTQEAADAAAKQYNLKSVSTYADPVSLAKDAKVDIVAVSVNVPRHYELIKPALEAGKDVFVEWPLARNLSEAEELTALAKEKGVRTLVGLQARQDPSIVKAKELIKSGKVGKILSTSMYGHGLIGGPITKQDYLYTNFIENGANLLTIPFGHAVDALTYVVGEIASLNATLVNNYPELSLVDENGKEIKKVEKSSHDHVSITGTLVSGGIVDVHYGPDSSRTGRNFYWEINGTEGSLVLEAPAGHVQMFHPNVKFVGKEPGAKLEEIEVEQSGGWAKGDFSFNVGRAWDAWAGVGSEKGGGVTEFQDALVRHRMIDAIYRSAERGTRESYL